VTGNEVQEYILQLARQELESLNELMDEVLLIPKEEFRKFGSSAFMNTMSKGANIAGHHDLAEGIDAFGGADQFDRLCEATPHIPREALHAFSTSYTALVMLFFDEKYTPMDDISCIRTLMLLREQKGFVLGMVTGTSSAQSEAGKAARAIFSKSGADVRHAENRAMKADVFAWLDANFIPGVRSMDDVALELAGSLVPAKFRAVRDWLKDWNKLRSTGTP
jgi:hypothetical protein